MIGKITSLDPIQRSVELQISPDVLRSEISKPLVDVDPCKVTKYVIDLRAHVLADVYHLLIKQDDSSKPIDFYRTKSKADMALLLDLLDGTIGERPRELKNIKTEHWHYFLRKLFIASLSALCASIPMYTFFMACPLV